jgi:hypothetical protein
METVTRNVGRPADRKKMSSSTNTNKIRCAAVKVSELLMQIAVYVGGRGLKTHSTIMAF